MSVLSFFKSNPPIGFRVPSVIGHGTFQGHNFIILNPLPTKFRDAPFKWQAIRHFFRQSIGPRVVLDASEVRATQWWQNFQTKAPTIPANIVAQLDQLIEDGLPVGHIHGDLGSNNLVQADGQLWVIDWEESTRTGPRRSDEISFYLTTHQKEILRRPVAATEAFVQTFLTGGAREDWRDVIVALAFLYGAERARLAQFAALAGVAGETCFRSGAAAVVGRQHC